MSNNFFLDDILLRLMKEKKKILKGSGVIHLNFSCVLFAGLTKKYIHEFTCVFKRFSFRGNCLVMQENGGGCTISLQSSINAHVLHEKKKDTKPISSIMRKLSPTYSHTH